MSKASKLLVEVTILAVVFCYLNTWVGPLSNRMGLLSNGVGLFLRERVLENMSTSLFEQPPKSIAHGRIFERLQ